MEATERKGFVEIFSDMGQSNEIKQAFNAKILLRGGK